MGLHSHMLCHSVCLFRKHKRSSDPSKIDALRSLIDGSNKSTKRCTLAELLILDCKNGYREISEVKNEVQNLLLPIISSTRNGGDQTDYQMLRAMRAYAELLSLL